MKMNWIEWFIFYFWIMRFYEHPPWPMILILLKIIIVKMQIILYPLDLFLEYIFVPILTFKVKIINFLFVRSWILDSKLKSTDQIHWKKRWKNNFIGKNYWHTLTNQPTNQPASQPTHNQSARPVGGKTSGTTREKNNQPKNNTDISMGTIC